MTQDDPVDEVSGSRQRTVLLATDRSHSIIDEIVDGKTNAIAYSAYGEQSAQQKVETRLGFNGQVREANIGWYLLGNGYRAYNPRLMRFHSPDSWSPFGAGGLNAYMYCVGDPVNRSDPTGHIFTQVKALKFAFGDFKKAIQMPGYRASPAIANTTPQQVSDALWSMHGTRKFEKTHGLSGMSKALSYTFGAKSTVNWSNDAGDRYGSGHSAHLEARNNPAVPWIVGGTSQAISFTGRPTNSGSLPNTQTTQLWNSDTKTAALNPQSSTTVYPVGVGSPSPSGPVQHGSTASSSVRSAPFAAVGSSTHSSVDRPIAAVAGIRRDPPPPQRNPSPSPPTSRDSTPPSSPGRNRRYGPNGDRYD